MCASYQFWQRTAALLLAEQGKHAEAADAYLRAALEFPEDDRARQMYYNAGLERQRAGDLQGADEAYTGLARPRDAANDDGSSSTCASRT